MILYHPLLLHTVFEEVRFIIMCIIIKSMLTARLKYYYYQIVVMNII